MEETPGDPTKPYPGMPPEVSRGFLMVTLLAPPALSILPGFTLPFFSSLDGLMLGVPLMILLLIPGLAFCFRDIVGVRYRGISLVFLVCSYLLGQFLGCFALLVGFIALGEWLKGP